MIATLLCSGLSGLMYSAKFSASKLSSMKVIYIGLFLCTRRSNTTARRLGTFWLLDNLSVEKCRDIRRQFIISLDLARWDCIAKTGSCSNKKETIYLVYINEAKLYCHLTIYLVLKYTIQGFIWRFYFGGGNMVNKDSKKGHNTLLCTVGAFATSQH